MDKQSQLKVIAAGFTILRSEDHPQIRIKYLNSNQHEWATLHKYESKAARDRALKEFLELSMFVED